MDPRARTTAAAAALILGALLVMALLNTVAFESFPLSGDEYAYDYQARTFLAGRLVNPPAPDPEAFHQVHVISTPEGMYSKYPPGWPAVLAAGEVAGAGGLVDPLLVALVLLLAFVFARRMAGDRVALVFLALMATGPFVLLNGAGFYPHPLVAVLWLAALWAFRSYHRRPRPGPAFAMGACYGAIFLARPQDVLFLVPATLVLVVLAVRRAGARAGLGHLAAAAAPLAAAGGLFLAYNAGTTGDPWLPGHLVSQPHDHPILSLRSLVRATGSRVLAYLEVSGVALASLLWWGPGGRRPFRPLLLLTALALLTMVAYGFYPYPDAPPHFGPRYWFPMHALLMLPAAWALARSVRARRLAAVIALIAAAQLAQTAFMAYSARLTIRAATGPRRAAVALANALDGGKALVVLTGPAGSVPYYDLVRNDLDYENPVLFIRADDDRDPDLRIARAGAAGWFSEPRRLFVWDGAGGLPVLRAVDSAPGVGAVYAGEPPVVQGPADRPGWTETTAGNRCGKRYYEHPGARPGDWTRFMACGRVEFGGNAPPGPGAVWPDAKRRWFARQYRSSLRVAEADSFVFRVLADEEARLWVDGRERLRALCATTGVPAEVGLRLSPGLHPLTLSYSNVEIPARLTWSVVRAADGRPVPADRFLTGATLPLDR